MVYIVWCEEGDREWSCLPLHTIKYIPNPTKIPILKKGKAFQLQAWGGPVGSKKLNFPHFMTRAQDGGKVVSPTHRPPLPPENAPGTHLCLRLSRPQGHSAIGRIDNMSMKNSNDTSWDRSNDLPIYILKLLPFLWFWESIIGPRWISCATGL